MATLLQKYNKELRQQMEGEVIEKKESKPLDRDPMQRYRDAFEDREYMEVIFSAADGDGSLYTMIDGVKVTISANSLLDAIPYYTAYNKDKYIGTRLIVRIKEIDEDTKTVYVVSGKSNQKTTKHRIMAEIRKQLSAEKHPVVICRVTKVYKDKVYLDILCKGIFGACSGKYFRTGFVHDLREEVYVNQLLEFEITGEIIPKKGDKTEVDGFRLSRLNLTSNPWKKIPPEIQEDSVILVKCVEKPSGKNYWWGTTTLVPDIELMCDYNDKLSIRELLTYKCKVTKLDIERKILRAVPFAETDIGIDSNTAENLRILTNNKKLK